MLWIGLKRRFQRNAGCGSNRRPFHHPRGCCSFLCFLSLLIVITFPRDNNTIPPYNNMPPSSKHHKKKPTKEERQETATAAASSATAAVKTVYMIRHGQSLGQTAKQHGIDRKRDVSLIDCGLSKKGTQEAQQIPSLLQPLEEDASMSMIELVVSSPLTRALETAVLGFHNRHTCNATVTNLIQDAPPILVHYGLREIGSSIPENIPRGDMAKVLKCISTKHGQTLHDHSSTRIDATTLQPTHWPPKHETDGHSAHVPKSERMQHIFQCLATERPEQIMAVVGHYNVIRAALMTTTPEVRPRNAIPIRCHLYPDGRLIPY